MKRLIDDRILGEILRSDAAEHADDDLYVTGCWYVRLCNAVLASTIRSGALSSPFVALPPEVGERAMRSVLELPDRIGLVSLRTLAPLIGQLRRRHALNALSSEALAAAVHLGADVTLSARSPKLEEALRSEGVAVAVGG